jgi:hypothetical protein
MAQVFKRSATRILSSRTDPEGPQAFSKEAIVRNITVVKSLQFATGSNVTEIVALLKSSGANVFLSFVYDVDHFNLLQEASKINLFGKDYVWFGSDGSATRLSLLNPVTGVLDNVAYDTMLGTIGTQVAGGTGDSYKSECKPAFRINSKWETRLSCPLEDFGPITLSRIWHVSYLSEV